MKTRTRHPDQIKRRLAPASHGVPRPTRLPPFGERLARLRRDKRRQCERYDILDRCNEILGSRLGTIHNLHFYLDLMTRIRASIAAGGFPAFARDYLAARKAPTAAMA